MYLITQTYTTYTLHINLFYKDINIHISHMLYICIKHYLSEPCVDCPSNYVNPFIFSSGG